MMMPRPVPDKNPAPVPRPIALIQKSKGVSFFGCTHVQLCMFSKGSNRYVEQLDHLTIHRHFDVHRTNDGCAAKALITAHFVLYIFS